MKIWNLQGASLIYLLMAGCGSDGLPPGNGSQTLGEERPGVLFEFAGTFQGDSLGREVEGVGDIDGDGLPDIAVGSPGKGNLSGEVHIYSGADGVMLHHFEGDVSGIVLGRTIASLGDIDGDDRADFIIAAPQSDLLVGENDLPDAGSVFVYSGASARLLYRYDGGRAGEYTGKSASHVGDIDGDGVDDFLFSAPGHDGFAGVVYLHSGATGGRLRAYRGKEHGGRYGWSVSGGGDLNDDGIADIVVGAPWSSLGGRVNAGAVYVYSGASEELLYRLDGEQAGDGFGNSVAMLGDVDGDQRTDFIVGAPLANPGRQQDAGSVFVFSGANGSILFRFDGGEPTSLLGFSVANAGDVDGDGIFDILTGGQWIDVDHLYNSGSAFVYSGATGELLHRIDGEEVGSELGFAVAGGGDLDGDHRDEVILGAPGGHGFAGTAQVVSIERARSPHS